VGRKRQEVFHDWIRERIESGKSEPRSTIQETVLESGSGEKMRAPRAE
jgi:hypothetical protein